MIGIQNSNQMVNPVRFGHDGGYYSTYDVNQERDEKMQGVNDIKDEFETLASTLEGNNDKVSQKASKIARGVATVVGIAGTFVMAKYGSRATINVLKNVAKSEPVMGAINSFKKLGGPAKKVVEGATTLIEKTGVKDSKVAKKAIEIINKEPVKKVIAKAGKLAGDGLKAVKGFNYQAAIENTLGASATASVVVDDLAGRNNDKSNFEVAMGASGGDK